MAHLSSSLWTNIYTILRDSLIPLVIIGILFIPLIVLDKYLGHRRKKERLGLKWKKLEERIGDEDIKAFVQLVAAKSEVKFDTKYPLMDANGNLLKHQPIASSVELTLGLERRVLPDQK